MDDPLLVSYEAYMTFMKQLAGGKVHVQCNRCHQLSSEISRPRVL